MKNILKGQCGATLSEYSLMLLLVAVVCVAAVTTFGSSVEGLFRLVLPF
jgi:Flp pilus assembly pilin Flp